MMNEPEVSPALREPSWPRLFRGPGALRGGVTANDKLRRASGHGARRFAFFVGAGPDAHTQDRTRDFERAPTRFPMPVAPFRCDSAELSEFTAGRPVAEPCPVDSARDSDVTCPATATSSTSHAPPGAPARTSRRDARTANFDAFDRAGALPRPHGDHGNYNAQSRPRGAPPGPCMLPVPSSDAHPVGSPGASRSSTARSHGSSVRSHGAPGIVSRTVYLADAPPGPPRWAVGRLAPRLPGPSARS